ncbi:MAG: alpha/beta hydrolase [Sphingomonadales bacterium]
MNPVAKFLLAIAVGYAIIVAIAYLMQRRLLYFPNPAMASPAMSDAADMAVVELDSGDGTRLIAWYRGAPPGRPTIALFQGNAGNIADRAFKARLFLDHGYGVLLAGYRGYGGSGGRPSEGGLIGDGIAALEYLSAQGVSRERLILYGESLGTGVAVRLAARRAVGAIILEAPYSSIVDVAARAYPYLPVGLLLKDRFDSMGPIGDVHAPVLMIHGAEDRVVAPELGARLFAAASDPKQRIVISGAGHNDVFELGGGKAALDFLDHLFPETGA